MLACTAVFIAVQEKPAPSPAQGDADAVMAVANKVSSLDADSDGLKDWEESLWKSDPKDKDTDGDGTEDGEEVRQSRNPVVKGPNDSMGSTTASLSATTTDEELTKTDAFAREFFTRYFDLKKNGSEIDQALEQSLVREMLQSTSLGIDAKRYSVKDVKTVAETPESIRAYGNALGAALTRNTPKGAKPEYEIFAKAMSDDDEEALRALDPIIQGYSKLLGEYSRMSVPSGAAIAHMNLLNVVSSILEDVRAMRAVFEDPVRTYAGIADYQNTVVALVNAIREVNAYFAASRITFTAGEPGYDFVHSTN